LVCAVAIYPIASFADPAPQPAPASAEAEAGSGGELNEVVITARKRNERLIDVPVAVVALDSKALEEQGVYSLNDLAQATPGLSADTAISGSARSDRSFNEYIIRGMTPNSQQNSTVTVFIDGAPFPSGQISGLDDLERVEVLEGPQTAYFGRATFAGAINLVTRDPANTPEASASVLLGSRDWDDVRASLEGPIVKDILTARLSLRYYTRDGSWQNEAAADKTSESLGDQSTRSGNLEVVFKPTEDLKIKAMGMFWEDRDGPAAEGYIYPSQSNCATGNGLRFFCGQVPSLLGNTPAANDIVDPFITSLLQGAANSTRTVDGLNFQFPSKYGLDRNASHVSFGLEWHIVPLGVTLNTLTAFDLDKFAELNNLDNVDGSSQPEEFPQSFFNFPFWVAERQADFSQEVRLTSEQDRPFRWMVGGNYAGSNYANDIGGVAVGLNFGGGVTTASTTGGFFSLAYDILKPLTLNVEGRYQRDRQSSYGLPGSFGAGAAFLTAVFNDFTPRVTLQYKLAPDVMTYVTYSQGVNPGTFNTTNPFQQSYINTNYPGFATSNIVSPEKLRNYELGLKGKFFDDKVLLTADVYYDLWTNQITTGGVLVPTAPGSSLLNLVQIAANDGASTIDGFELSADWTPESHWTFHFGGAINNTKITSGLYAQAGQIAYGTLNPTAAQQTYNGNELPNAARFQTQASVQYNWVLGALPDWNWFARFGDSYKSRQFMDQANRVYAPGLNFGSLRVGTSAHGFRVEAFIDNLFDEKQVTNIIPFPYEVIAPIDDSLIAGLPYKFSFGLRASYKFGGP
jgi:iron complex outermembrane receptor protein